MGALLSCQARHYQQPENHERARDQSQTVFHLKSVLSYPAIIKGISRWRFNYIRVRFLRRRSFVRRASLYNESFNRSISLMGIVHTSRFGGPHVTLESCFG